MGAIKELDFVNNSSLRQKYLEKVSVLDKVKKLITLPNTELMTTRMVAEYYEVSEDVIRDNIRRNRDELESNGMSFKSYGEIKQIVNRENISQLKISRKGVNVFTKRAVLNIGMLLRDSEVAKRVRSALLDIEEVTPVEQKVVEIDKEKELVLKVVFAESEEEKLLALKEYRDYKERHIRQLEEIIEDQKPKVESFDHFLSARNCQNMTKVAKSLKVGRNNLFKFLRDEGVFLKSDAVPYQRYIDSKYFIVKQTIVSNGTAISQTLVTPKGIQFLSRLLKENAHKYDYMQKYLNDINSIG